MRRVIVAALLASAGCQSSFSTTDELAPAVSKRAVLLPVPVVAQDSDNACGLACLVSLLRYHGSDVDDEARRRFPPGAFDEKGIAAGELRDYLRGRGFRAHLVHGSLDDVRPAGLLWLLSQRLPPIVSLRIESANHYVLVCGFDPESRLIFAMDPARGIGGVPYAKFEGYWLGTERVMLAVAPAARPTH